MKFSKLIFLFVLFFSLTSCYEKLDFDQLDNYVYKPIFTSSLTSFTLVPGQFFNSQGVQENSIVDETRFEIFETNIVKDNVVQLDFYAEIKNEFDRDVTINIDFLDDNDREIYTFSTINVRSGELNFTYLEEIEISQNPDIVNVTKVKIEASLENTGTQMNPNSTEEFEFKSSVTAYIQTKL